MDTNMIFQFNYQLTSVVNNEMIHMGTVALELTDKEVAKVAQVIHENGGFAVELPKIKWLDERVGIRAIDDYQFNYADKDFN